MQKHILSKSTFMRGHQCQKSLYLNKFRKELRDELTEQQRAIFASGTNVGILAQELFPGGKDCTPEHFYNFGPAVEKTTQLIKDGQKVIYEAAFQHEGVLVALDILVKNNEGWKAYELKSSTSVKPQFKKDAALQYSVIKNSGLDLVDISIVHLNSKYIRKGDLDIIELFTVNSVLDYCIDQEPWVKENIQKCKDTLSFKSEPVVNIGPQCHSPYTCDYKNHCWKNVPENSVFELTNIGNAAWEMYNKGIVQITDIPKDYPLSNIQKIQVESEVSGEEVINPSNIKSFLKQLKYPLYHFDFETYQLAIPMFNGTNTYQQTPFQYSIHIQSAAGAEPIHKEFLADPELGDPREELILQMLDDIAVSGDILVYNLSFESSRLKELARDFPDYKDQILAVKARLKDLATPFQNRDYYTKAMKGKYSLKNVLPAVVPELSYENLNIQEGGTASITFANMLNGSFEGDAASVRKDLLEYCKLDTLAMVKLLKKLYLL